MARPNLRPEVSRTRRRLKLANACFKASSFFVQIATPHKYEQICSWLRGSQVRGNKSSNLNPAPTTVLVYGYVSSTFTRISPLRVAFRRATSMPPGWLMRRPSRSPCLRRVRSTQAGGFLPKIATHFVCVAAVAFGSRKTQAFIKRRCGSDGLQVPPDGKSFGRRFQLCV